MSTCMVGKGKDQRQTDIVVNRGDKRINIEAKPVTDMDGKVVLTKRHQSNLAHWQ